MTDRVSAWMGLSEGLLTRILDHLPVGVGAVGPDLRTFVLNETARRLLALPGSCSPPACGPSPRSCATTHGAANAGRAIPRS
jgi:hypothetical protein